MTGFRLCDFCQVETTAPLLFVDIDGFGLDVCPQCWKTQFTNRGEEE